MNNNAIYLFFIKLITLFCIEICSANFYNPYFPNALIIFLAYLLYENRPSYQTLTTLLFIESICLLQTGIIGISFIVLIPMIFYFVTIKTLLHFKLLTPYLFLYLYQITYETLIFLLTKKPYNLIHVILQATVNCIAFLIIYTMIQTLQSKKAPQ